MLDEKDEALADLFSCKFIWFFLSDDMNDWALFKLGSFCYFNFLITMPCETLPALSSHIIALIGLPQSCCSREIGYIIGMLKNKWHCIFILVHFLLHWHRNCGALVFILQWIIHGVTVFIHHGFSWINFLAMQIYSFFPCCPLLLCTLSFLCCTPVTLWSIHCTNRSIRSGTLSIKSMNSTFQISPIP